MEERTAANGQERGASRQFVRRLLTVGENRLELLTVEMQEERERLLQALLVALGVAVFCLLAGMVFTALVVLLFWPYSPVGVLLGLTLLYGGTGVQLARRLTGTLRDWQMLSGTLDQLRKDRACLEKLLE
jgi:uncharacterized membrane protein YqjE